MKKLIGLLFILVVTACWVSIRVFPRSATIWLRSKMLRSCIGGAWFLYEFHDRKGKARKMWSQDRIASWQIMDIEIYS